VGERRVERCEDHGPGGDISTLGTSSERRRLWTGVSMRKKKKTEQELKILAGADSLRKLPSRVEGKRHAPVRQQGRPLGKNSFSGWTGTGRRDGDLLARRCKVRSFG